MTYSLKFHEKALKEWQKLGEPIRNQLKKKLMERLENPHVQADRLSGFSTALYKIKLRSSGYRLVYEVNDNQIYIQGGAQVGASLVTNEYVYLGAEAL